MIPATVRYARASNVDDALQLLAEPDAKAIAGGQSLLPVIKARVARPSLIVDIGRLGLGGVTVADGDLHVGPLVTWDELISASALSGTALAAIPECAREIGDLQVRNRGTIGGSLAHADPASDMPAVLLALGAALRLRSQDGERTLPLTDFLLGPFTTALEATELIVDIVVPLPAPGSGSAYVSLEHPASGFALAGAATLVGPDASSAVAVTGIGSKPFLLPANRDPGEALAGAEIYGDRFASAEYRRHLATVVARRALDRATRRMEVDQP